MPLYDDASIMLLASGAAGLETKDASKVYNVKPAPITTGSELVTNGGFDADSDWTKSGEATISGGKGNIISSTGTYAALNQSNVFVIGKKYKISLDVTVNTNEHSFAIKLQDGAVDANIGKVTTSGSYVFYHTAAATTLTIARFSPNDGSGGNSATDVDVDNVSVFEVDTVPADFDISRDDNLDATRVGPNGLVEKGRENLLHYSNNFATVNGGGGWGHSGINNISTGQDGYDGTTNATFIHANTAENKHQVTLGVAQSLPGEDFSITGVFTLSVHAKPNGYDHLILRSDIANINASFNIATGVVGTRGSKCIASSMTYAGNGFYRCQATFNHSASVQFLAIGMMEQDDTTDFVGNISKGVILQDAQLEVGLVATEFIPSTGTPGTAGLKEDEPRFDYPPLGGAPSLLIEPERQNLVPQSEYFPDSQGTRVTVTVNTTETLSPEGVYNAVKMMDEATGDANHTHVIESLDTPFSLNNSTVYTVSAFVKDNGRNVGLNLSSSTGLTNHAVFDLSGSGEALSDSKGSFTTTSIESYGNGWFRIIAIGTTDSSAGVTKVFIRGLDRENSNSPSYLGDATKGIYFYGVQLEKGKNPTSYIPCHGTSATRSADVVPEVEHGIDFDTTISVFLEASKFNADSQTSFLQLRTGTDSNNRLLFFSNTSPFGSTHDVQVQHRESGTTVNRSISGVTAGDFFKILAKVDGTTFTAFINGQKITGNAVVSADVYDKISLIRNGNVTDQSGHKIKSVIVFDDLVSDADAFVLTDTSYESYSEAADSLNYIQHG